MNSTLIIGVTGIVVSGIVGPAAAARFARQAQTRDFGRAQAAGRRDALRLLLDQAAVLLASGATNLRMLQEKGADPDQLRAAKEWQMQIFPIGQRLQLWLPHDDPVVIAYERVRERLIEAGKVGHGHDPEQQLQQFEAARREFLELARKKLLEPITGGVQ